MVDVTFSGTGVTVEVGSAGLALSAAAEAEAAADRAELAAAQAVLAAGGDGYFHEPTYGYRQTFRNVNGKIALVIVPDVVIDPINGNDANNGLTAATAVKTTAALWNHPAFGAAGTAGAPVVRENITIGVVGHGDTKLRIGINGRGPLAENGYRTLRKCSLVEVTGTKYALISCADVATPGDFAPHATVSGAYTITFPHAMSGGEIRHQVNIAGEKLKRVSGVGALVAGTFIYTGNVGGSATTLHIFPFDGYDPRTGSKDVEITARAHAFAAQGGFCQGWIGHMNGHNDGSRVLINGPSAVVACGSEWGTKHNCLDEGTQIVGSYAANGFDGDYAPDEAFTPSLFVAYSDLLDGKALRYEGCTAIADATGQRNPIGQTSDAWLSHDNTGASAALIELADFTVEGCGPTRTFPTVRVSITGGWFNPKAGVPAIQCGNTVLEVSRSIVAAGTGGRLIDCANVGGYGNVKVRASLLIASDGALSGGGVTSVNQNAEIDMQECILVAPPIQAAPAIDLTNGGKLTIRHNAFAGFATNFVLAPYTASPTFAVTYDGDFNVTMERNFYGYTLGTGRTLAAQKAAYPTQDQNSVVGANISVSGNYTSADCTAMGFVSGTLPTVADPDVRLIAGSPMALKLRDPLTIAEALAMKARPKTIAALRASLLTVPRIPVAA